MKLRPTFLLVLMAASLALGANNASAQATFQRLPGVALDIGVGGPQNTAWVVGSDRKAYRWTGSSWQVVGGENLQRIAVDPQGNPWAVNTATGMLRLTGGSSFQTVPGQAKDIGVGNDGSVYHAGMGNTLFRWTGSGWGSSFGSDAVQVAVDPRGNPWTVGSSGQIARYVNNVRQVVPGEARDIAVGSNGSVLVIGGDNRRIWRWDGAASWIQVGEVPGATRLAVDSSGAPWVITQSAIFRGPATPAPAQTPPTPPTPPPPTPPTPPASGDARDAFRNLVLGFPTWATFSPERPDQKQPTGAATRAPAQRVGSNAYDCVTTPYTLTETPDRIVTFNPDANVLWPGALLQGKGYKLGIGSLKELAIRQRAPLAVSINLQTAGNSAVVTNPTNETVGAAIGGIIETAQNRGVQAPTSISYQRTEAFSSEQLALSLGVSASYLASSVKGTFNFQRDASQRTVSAIFRETAFTVSVTAPQTPSSFLSPQWTGADLQAQLQQGTLGKDNIPVYVSSVTYGRMLMFSLTSSASAQEIGATLDAMYQGGAVTVEGNLSASQKTLLRNSRIDIVTIGGDAENARRLIASGRLSEYFGRTNSLSTYRPLSYEVRNLGDGSIAKISETTNYNVTECSVLTAKKVGERWVNVLDGIYLDEPGDDSEGNIFGTVFFPTARGVIFNTPRASAITLKQGSILGANRLITVPGVRAIQGDGRFDENNNFLVRDYLNASAPGLELFVLLLDADYTLGNADDAIIVRAESNPILLANPFGGSNRSMAPRISGVGSGSPGSATVLYRQKKLCNLLEDPVTKQIVPEEPCMSPSVAIAQP